MNLSNWARQAKAHWKEFQPTRYQALKQQETLDLAAQQAADQTYREMDQLEQAGYQPDEAFQMVRERYLLPPEEEGLEDDDEPSTMRRQLLSPLGDNQNGR